MTDETLLKLTYMVAGAVAFELAYPFIRMVAFAVLDAIARVREEWHEQKLDAFED